MPTENPHELLINIGKILSQLGIQYFITGGFAISVWGRPRATFDIDIVVQLIEPDIAPLKKVLQRISKYGYFDEEIALEEVRKKGEFNFIDPESGLKVDFWVSQGDSRSHELFQRRKTAILSGEKIHFISPEDLILSKLQWYEKSGSSRHLEDIESVFKISGEKLDTVYLKKWATKLDPHGLLKKWL